MQIEFALDEKFIQVAIRAYKLEHSKWKRVDTGEQCLETKGKPKKPFSV